MMANPSAEDKFILEVGIALDQKSLTQFQKDYLQAMEKMVKQGATISDAQMRLGNGDRFSGGDPEAIKRVNAGVKQLQTGMSGVAQESQKVATNVQKVETNTKNAAKQADNYRESFQDLNKGVNLNGMFGLGGGGGATGKFAGLSGFFNKWTSGLTDFGAIAKGVFGGIIGVTAVEAIQKLIQYMGEAVDMAAKFERSLLTLELGVRAMQRQGIEISTQEVFDAITKIQEKYKIFTEQDIIKGTNIFVNNLREMGVTTEQVYQIMEIAAKASTLTGKSFEETARILNQAAVAGYSRTLNVQELGIPFSAKLAQQEAIRLGYTEKTFAQLDAQTRTLIVISLLNREIADYDQDILKIQETASGQLQQQQAQMEQIKKDLGETILPLWVMVLQVVQRIAEQLTAVGAIVLRPIVLTITAIESLWALATGKMDEAIAKSKELEVGIKNLLKDIFTLLFGGDLKRAVFGASELTPQLGDVSADQKGTTSTEVGDNAAEVLLATQKMEDDRLKIEQDYADKSAEIERQRAEKIEDANIDLARELEDIDRDLARDREKASRKLAADLDKIELDAARATAEAYRKYAEDKLEAERDLQNQLRELRDKALFDLEEAARMGDALQARKILRQYRFDKDQAIKTANHEAEDRLIKFQQELEDIRKQAAQKRAERLIDFEQEMADLEMQAAYKRADANRHYQQQLADIAKWAEREIELNRQKYTQELADLRAKLEAELAMLQDAADQAAAIQGAAEAHVGVPPTEHVADAHVGVPPGFAKGGQIIANKPTVAMFGEAGAEMATFVPLSKLGRNDGNVGGGGVGGMNGRLALEIMLSPGLVASITENTLNELTGVVASVERSR
jgi:hypothetical protein